MKNVSRIVIVILAVAALLSGCTDEPAQVRRVDIVQALSGQKDTACYAKADRRTVLKFPQDLGAHDDFRTEWWYFTGNLKTVDGREFGFQLTFFRQALDCKDPEGASAFRSRQLYFAHFGLTDVMSRAFYSGQRMNRAAVGTAGAQGRPFKVWIDNWQAGELPGRPKVKGLGPKEVPARFRLAAQDVLTPRDGTGPVPAGIELVLERSRPALAQGRKGWSQKGPDPASASHYYSFPAMTVRGTVLLGNKSHEVTGTAWFDHEWSTAVLGDQVQGWDWFALNLERPALALMVCQVRQKQGPPFKFGSLSVKGRSDKILGPDQFDIAVLSQWTSPATGKTYPSRWRIRVPSQGLDFGVVPLVADQEHDRDFVYWEGAVKITEPDDSVKKPKPSGRGYVEMTGY